MQQAHDELERRVEERTAELTKANEELQAVYDGMVDGLLVVDLETKRFVRTNTAMCRLLGYSEEQLLSMNVMEIHPPEVVPNVLEKFQRSQRDRDFLPKTAPFSRKTELCSLPTLAIPAYLIEGVPVSLDFSETTPNAGKPKWHCRRVKRGTRRSLKPHRMR